VRKESVLGVNLRVLTKKISSGTADVYHTAMGNLHCTEDSALTIRTCVT
jgi:hypothetical protein